MANKKQSETNDQPVAPSAQELAARLITLKAQAFDVQSEVNRLSGIYNQLHQQIVLTAQALSENSGDEQ